MTDTPLGSKNDDRQGWADRTLQTLVQQARGGLNVLEPLADSLGEALLVVDSERNLLMFNRQAEEVTGFSRDQVLGRHCLTGFKCTTCLETCGIFNHGQIHDVPLELYRSDGKLITVVKNARVVHDEAGEVIGAVELFREVESGDEALTSRLGPTASETTLENLERLMASLGRGFALLDESFSFRRASPTFARLVGIDANSMVGRLAVDVLGEELFGQASPFRKALIDGERREGWRATARRSDGGVQPLSVTGAPLLDELRCDASANQEARFLVVVRPETPASSGDVDSEESTQFEGMVARSEPMRRVFQVIELLRDSDATILITGESGTGKELVARAVHNRSTRANQPFVAVNCGALPGDLLESELFGHAKGAFTGAIRHKPGRFEVADEGTIFLDEIGDMPLPLQVKLLRVLQERSFERVGETASRPLKARVLAATHHDLPKLVAERRFRDDLFYRLNVVPIHLLPLRDRREDLEVLIQHLLDNIGQRRSRSLRLSPSAMRTLMSNDWLGNVRQLENALEYATAICEGQTIHRKDLPPELVEGGIEITAEAASIATASEETDDEMHPPSALTTDPMFGRRAPTADTILATLQKTRYQRSEAAKLLGVSRTTLWRWMKTLGL